MNNEENNSSDLEKLRNNFLQKSKTKSKSFLQLNENDPGDENADNDDGLQGQPLVSPEEDTGYNPDDLINMYMNKKGSDDESNDS